MKLSQALAIAFATRQMAQAADNWYPDWTGGSGTCLDDDVTDDAPLYMKNNGYLKDSIEDCCDSYYQSTKTKCIVDGGGTPPTGSGKWYVDYENARCVADCAVGGTNSPYCGGYASPSDTLFGTASTTGGPGGPPDDCCETKLGYMALGQCYANTDGAPYMGSNNVYVDYQNNRCVRDCPTSGAGSLPDCGGLITDSYTTLFNRYTASGGKAECCAAKLSSLDGDLCIALSDPAQTGTGKYYADVQDSKCIEDTDATKVPKSAVLYDDAADCCAGALGWVNSFYCKSRSDNHATGFTGLWYVDYQDQVCVKDCTNGSSDECKELEAPPNKLDATADACCSNQLGWLDGGVCVATSSGGPAAAGSGEWYVDYQNKRCVQDCPVPPAGAPTCGGLAPSYQQTFVDEESCCESKLGYFATGYCEANSNSVPFTGSSDWYVDYQNNRCVQDCPTSGTGSGPLCGGVIIDSSTFMYDSAAECCDGKLGWINEAACAEASLSAGVTTGNNQWYAADSGVNKCVRNCAVDGTSPCGGVIGYLSSKKLYQDIEDCCSNHFGYIDGDLCVAISENTPSTQFYVDYQNEKCVQACPGSTAPCGGFPSDLSTQMFDDFETCCSSKLSYVKASTCEANTFGIPSIGGSDDWYVNWTLLKCVKDCATSVGPDCGGLAESWDVLFSSGPACCKTAMSWKDEDDCLP